MRPRSYSAPCRRAARGQARPANSRRRAWVCLCGPRVARTRGIAARVPTGLTVPLSGRRVAKNRRKPRGPTVLLERRPVLVAVTEQALDLAAVDRPAVDAGVLREPAHRLARGVEDVLDRVRDHPAVWEASGLGFEPIRHLPRLGRPSSILRRPATGELAVVPTNPAPAVRIPEHGTTGGRRFRSSVAAGRVNAARRGIWVVVSPGLIDAVEALDSHRPLVMSVGSFTPPSGPSQFAG